MATYSFHDLHDNSITCLLSKYPSLLAYVHDRGAYDAAGYADALDYWWVDKKMGQSYVSIDDLMKGYNCPMVPKETAVTPTAPAPTGLEGLLGNKYLLLGGGAVLLFLMFGRRR